MSDTITRPSWLAEVTRRHGEPSSLKGHDAAGFHRVQRTWEWTDGARHIRVALVSYDDGPMRVVYVEYGDAKVRLDLDDEPTNRQVLDLLRAVGVLAPLVRAVDCGNGAWWFTPSDGARRTVLGEEPGPGDRPLLVDGYLP